MRPHELVETGDVLCHVEEYVNGRWTTILTTRDQPFARQLAEGLNVDGLGRVLEFSDAARKAAMSKRRKRRPRRY